MIITIVSNMGPSRGTTQPGSSLVDPKVGDTSFSVPVLMVSSQGKDVAWCSGDAQEVSFSEIVHVWHGLGRLNPTLH